MLSCREIVKIINAQGIGVPFVKKVETQMHLFMCKHCSAYSQHIKLIRIGFKRLFSKVTQVDSAIVKRIEKEIIEQINK